AATPPGPVTALTPVATDPTVNHTLSLHDALPISGVTIRRATGTTPPASVTAGTAVATVSKPTATYTDSNLAAGTVYSYAVFARSSVAHSSTLLSQTDTVLPDAPPTTPVTGLTTVA